MAAKEMTKGERDELKRLARERARVAKADVARRSADLKADFEAQIANEYDFNRDEVWKQAVEASQDVVAEMIEKIKDRCAELGIPRELAPSLSLQWHARGPGAVAARSSELRRVSHKRIEAMERTATHEIDRAALEIQTQLVRAGLTSDQAIEFLGGMPSVDALMPGIQLGQLDPVEFHDGDQDLW